MRHHSRTVAQSFRQARLLRLVVSLVALAMVCSVPAGAGAETAGSAPASLGQAVPGVTMLGTAEPLTAFADGIRVFVFACPEDYPASQASLDELYADCEFRFIVVCLDWPTPVWNPSLPQRWCDSHQRP